MNIFALSNDPGEAARFQHDRHVIKMILESAQMLSTACHLEPGFMDLLPPQYVPTLYKPTHANHPCNVWVRKSRNNFAWLTLHLDALLAEYHRRFQKTHKTYNIALGFNAAVCKMAGVERMWERDETRNLRRARDVADMGFAHTEFAVCMPDDCKSIYGPIDSYQCYYAADKIFQNHVKWTKCESLPDFLTGMLFRVRTPAKVQERIMELVDANKAQNAPLPYPLNPKPFVPAGFAAPSFLRRK